MTEAACIFNPAVGRFQLSRTKRVWMSPLQVITVTPTALTSGTAYWQYVGFVPIAITVQSLRYFLVTAGGSNIGELALASTPSAPNGASQVLTKIFAAAFAASLTSGAPTQRQQAISQVIPAGTHLWAGSRVNSSPPVFTPLTGEIGEGQILVTAAAGALTGTGPWTGALGSTTAVASQCPKISVCLD